MSKLLSFQKLHNTRDLGGMKTTDGYTITPGELFRSGHLSDLTPEDIEDLSSMAGTIIDFRSDNERQMQPDMEIPGAENIHIPIVEELRGGISREKDSDQDVISRFLFKPDEAKEYMCQMYRAFVDDFSVKQYSRFLEILCREEKPVLWHCTAGKDRARIASVIVEEILGVSRGDIVFDYLKTGEYLKGDIGFLTQYIKKLTGVEDDNQVANDALRYLFGTEPDYLRAYYDAVDAKYGDYDQFIRQGLQVSDEMKDQLRKKYLS